MPTLATLRAAGARVWWKCQECGAAGDVDVAAVIAARGPDFDLTDRHPPCKAPGCRYWVGFYVQQGMRNTALRTAAGDLRQMDRRTAWLRRTGRLGSETQKAPPPGRGDGARGRGSGFQKSEA